MRNMEISKQLKADIDANQVLLKSAICNHHMLVERYKNEPNNNVLQKQLEEAQEEIIMIGLEQKSIIEKLRQELKEYHKNLKTEVTKNGIEEKRLNFTNVLSRNRKQNIITRSISVASGGSDDSAEQHLSGRSSPETNNSNPIYPHDISQSAFLQYFGLVTHEVYRERLNRRVERKRRSTVNPHFLYGNRSWDYTVKRQKRSGYLVSSVSPPNTRQAAARNKSKVERSSPPLPPPPAALPHRNGVDAVKKVMVSFPTIPNLPSGLTIERVSPNRSSPDPKICIACRQTGTSNLSVCESCFNGFHIGCHNRPLTHTPRHCPRCMSNKEIRTVGSLNVPSGMSVSYVSTSDVSEKLEEKKALQEQNNSLMAELNQMKARHSQLTILLKNQKCQREELLTTQQTTQEKINKLLLFVNNMKAGAATQAVQTP